jgi:DNA-directed RNA polymerase beta subunit
MSDELFLEELSEDQNEFKDTVHYRDPQVQFIKRYLEYSNGLIGYIIELFNESIDRIPEIFTNTVFQISENNRFRIVNPQYFKPTINANLIKREAGVRREQDIYPNEALTLQECYMASLFVQIQSIENPKNISPPFELVKIPVMLKSKLCRLLDDNWREQKRSHDPRLDELANDPGGYFIMKHEKILLLQNRLLFNMVIVREQAKKNLCASIIVRYAAISKQIVINPIENKKRTIFYVSYDSSQMVDKIRGINIILALQALKVKNDQLRSFILSINPKDDGDKIVDIFLDTLSNTIDDANTMEYDEQIYKMDIEMHTTSDTPANRKKAVENFKNSLFHHIDTDAGKAQMLMYMLVRLLRAIYKFDPLVNIRSDSNKQYQTPGIIIEKRLQQLWKELYLAVKQKIKDGAANNLGSIVTHIQSSKMTMKIINDFINTNWGTGLQQETGVTEYVSREASNVSLYGLLTRVKIPNKVSRAGKGVPPVALRVIQPTQVATTCLEQTPDSDLIGITRNTAFAARVSLEVDPDVIWTSLYPNIEKFLSGKRSKKHKNLIMFNATPVGWGNSDFLFEAIRNLRREGKIDNGNKPYFELGLYIQFGTLWINVSGGRPYAPRIVLYKYEYDYEGYKLYRSYRKPMGEKSWDELLRTGVVEYVDTMEINHITEGGLVREFLRNDDKLMELFRELVTAPKEKKDDVYKRIQFFKQGADWTHLLLDPTVIFGISTSMIPFVGYQQSQRTVFGAKMNEQAYNYVPLSTEYNISQLIRPELEEQFNRLPQQYRRRFGAKSRALIHAEQSLVCTTGQKIVKQGNPSTSNLIIAFINEEADQEDSIIINQNVIDNQIISMYVLETYEFTETYGTINEIFFKPLPTKDKTYEHLDNDGIPEVGMQLRKDDVVIGVVKINTQDKDAVAYVSLRNSVFDLQAEIEYYIRLEYDEIERLDSKEIQMKIAKWRLTLETPSTFENFVNALQDKYREIEEKLKSMKTPELITRDLLYTGTKPAYIDSVVLSEVKTNTRTVRIQVRTPRAPIVGDKQTPEGFSQKATIGKVKRDQDMPFLEDGTHVHIIANSFPNLSRMTNSWLLQILIGTMNALAGTHQTIDFARPVDMAFIQRELLKYGYSAVGRQQLYNGETGELYEADVFVGFSPTEFLKHQVDDKIKVRGTGAVSFSTGEPTKSARDKEESSIHMSGMEIDAIVASGAAGVAKERLIDTRAPVELVICRVCSTTTNYHSRPGRYVCPKCNSNKPVRAIISKPVRALTHILAAGNMMIKFVVEKGETRFERVSEDELLDEDEAQLAEDSEEENEDFDEEYGLEEDLDILE